MSWVIIKNMATAGDGDWTSCWRASGRWGYWGIIHLITTVSWIIWMILLSKATCKSGVSLLYCFDASAQESEW